MPILCGTDFSPAATGAVDAAVAIARRARLPLSLVHAEGHPLHLSALPDTSHGMRDAAARHAQVLERLERAVAAARTHDVVADGTLDARSADVALLDRARHPGVELLVLGALGHTALERLLLGSVAERVTMSSPRPVIVVRDGAPWRQWDAHRAPLRVAVAFDSGASARDALAWAGWLASLGEVRLSACWVVHPAFENERHGASGEGAGIELLPATLDALTSELARRTREVLPDRPVSLQLEANMGRVDGALVDWSRREHADLLVVGSHQRHGFERLWNASISRGLLHHAPMSVAVVPHAMSGAGAAADSGAGDGLA
ncbi:MAG: universal stress protein [Gemmatimonadaceae bacterium]|nr:universal stress protein [Gemmatimonadaceae bacterium]